MERMNRAQRRALERRNQKNRKHAEASNQRTASVLENKLRAMSGAAVGPQLLTAQDLDASYNQGFSAGYSASAVPTVQAMYAAILVAAHETYGFGQTRGVRLLRKVHEIFTQDMTSEALVQKVIDDLDVEFEWTDEAKVVTKGASACVGPSSNAAALP